MYVSASSTGLGTGTVLAHLYSQFLRQSVAHKSSVLDEWVEGWMVDGWIDEWVGRWMDGWIDG